MFDSKKSRAIAVLIGTTVGAGIFALPYAFSKVGFLIGLVYLIVLGLAVLTIEICYAEIILRTKEKKEMAGYVKTYLGRTGEILIALSLILGIYAALAAYIIGVGTYLQAFFAPFLGGNLIFWGLIFWFFGSLICFFGINLMSRFELFMSAALIVVAIFIFILSLPYLKIENLVAHDFVFNFKNLFYPFGIILFALGGASAIPTMKKILKEENAFLKKAVIIGFIIPVIIYTLFGFTVLGVSGRGTSEEGIIGLSNFLGEKVLLIGGVFGVLAMCTSFFALSFVLKELLRKDYKIKNFYAWASTVSVPLFLFLLGAGFAKIIGFSGAVLSGFQGIILIETYYRAKVKGEREPEFEFNLPKPIAYLIYLIFILGLIHQICFP
ncbi:hypothetical protein COW09_01190 [bacterium (Candidatus Moisslbacteria) CG12_big_fil_rev_8_21_14_0_65_36_11]|nr:MAG: hypothetical protein COW09_01190 [bacterium (Candidatus Moisslbacteria) CG12_big_fil_rev_8_21_14_0_65_36_11]